MSHDEQFQQLIDWVTSRGSLYRRARHSWASSIWRFKDVHLFQVSGESETWVRWRKQLYLYRRGNRQIQFRKGSADDLDRLLEHLRPARGRIVR